MALTSPVKDGDWRSVRQAIQQLAHLRLGPDSSPTFKTVNVSTIIISGTSTVGELVIDTVDVLPAPVIDGKIVRLSTDKNLYLGRIV